MIRKKTQQMLNAASKMYEKKAMANNRALQSADRASGKIAQAGMNAKSNVWNNTLRPIQHAEDKMFVKNITKAEKLKKAASKIK